MGKIGFLFKQITNDLNEKREENFKVIFFTEKNISKNIVLTFEKTPNKTKNIFEYDFVQKNLKKIDNINYIFCDIKLSKSTIIDFENHLCWVNIKLYNQLRHFLEASFLQSKIIDVDINKFINNIY